MSAFLAFENVRFAQGENLLFGPASVTLPTRGVTAVLGPNGSGKSLFLGLAHGLLKPSAGSVIWPSGPARATRRERGYIFQAPIVMRRSVKANIRFALSHAKLSAKEKSARVEELLQLVGLTEHANKPAAVLSGGQGQGLALARALAAGPACLLMDEPTSNLDPKFSTHFEAIIDQLTSSGIAVYWATHDLIQARRIATYVVIIVDGEIAEYGPANEVLRNPKSEGARAFLEGTF